MTTASENISRPKLLNHLIKCVVFGWAAYQFAKPLRDVDTSAMAIVLWGSVTWLCLAGLLRNLHALVVLPVLEASPDGLHLRYWKPTRLFTWSMFLPFNRVVDANIPWSDYRGCRTSIISGGDPWDGWQRLFVETDRGLHEIGWDVFAGSVTRLMYAINDYREHLLRGPSKAGLAVADFQRMRFAEPLRLEQTVTKSGWMEVGCFVFLAPLLLVMGGCVGVMALMGGSMALMFVTRSIGMDDASEFLNQDFEGVETPFGELPLLVLIGAVGGVITMAGWFLWMMWKDARIRVLELRADGLAYGSKPHALTLIPWEDVLYAGIMTETTWRGEGAGASSEHLGIRCRDRSTLVLSGNYQRSLSDIKELVDPSVDKLAMTRRELDHGSSLERALQMAGLPTQTSA